jgi:lysophosphatidylcholine acyltransferase/lyso-PAF acetyltransferase
MINKEMTDGLDGGVGCFVSSQWDILYFMSSHYPSFVANSGVAKIRMVGTICESMGSMFIRRDADDVTHGDAAVKGNAARMVERLTDPTAPRMLVFPEGTTTNGTSLLPFKRGPFLAKVPVQPVLLQYDYKYFSPAWESIAPVPSLALMSMQWVNTLRVQYLPVYTPSEVRLHP